MNGSAQSVVGTAGNSTSNRVWPPSKARTIALAASDIISLYVSGLYVCRPNSGSLASAAFAGASSWAVSGAARHARKDRSILGALWYCLPKGAARTFALCAHGLRAEALIVGGRKNGEERYHQLPHCTPFNLRGGKYYSYRKAYGTDAERHAHERCCGCCLSVSVATNPTLTTF